MVRIIKPGELRGEDILGTARWLLGKALVRTTENSEKRLLINEVEAYDGESDLACHASKGRTKRTEVLYQSGGIWYVYLCYGIHEMLNLVAGPSGHPAAILIRGAGEIVGPGRLTKRLQIDRRLNGLSAEPASGLHLEDVGIEVPRRKIKISPRIGVDYAGPIWAAKPWRFYFESAGFVAGAGP
ncbi:MAG: DNA-3-methyladenine glycosylase [Lacunisphaera sp.]